MNSASFPLLIHSPFNSFIMNVHPSFTRRDSGAFRLFLREISKIPLLTHEQEEALAVRIQDGDRGAVDELALANIRFAIRMAKRFQGRGLPLEDLVAESYFGLVKAAEKFDHTKGFRFITYAVWWIRQSIMDAIVKTGRPIRMPEHHLETLLKVKAATVVLEQQLERRPEEEEIAAFLDITPLALEHARAVERPVKSLDTPLGSSEQDFRKWGDLIPDVQNPDPAAGLDAQDAGRMLDLALVQLTVRHADVLRRVFGLGGRDPMTLKEIGEEMGLTAERVRQLRDEAIRTLCGKAPTEALRIHMN